MGKLYAITAGSYSDYHIITLCSDKEKAHKISLLYNAEVEEFEDGKNLDTENIIFEVVFDDDYKYMNCWQYFVNPDKIKLNEVTSDGNLYKNYTVFVAAKNKEQALKIARDNLTEYKARELGI